MVVYSNIPKKKKLVQLTMFVVHFGFWHVNSVLFVKRFPEEILVCYCYHSNNIT
uniref:Uncharacterized protein n=1 Tax=Octopus bimaculoides TaxID=37653 RepID=A0A0L8HM66_OCTBM